MSLRSESLIRTLREQKILPRAGAEIGVFKGETSRDLLNAFPGLYMRLVDPWQIYDHKEMRGEDQKGWDAVFNLALRNIGKKNINRCTVQRMSSMEAARYVSKGVLDFVFIDAKHDKDSVCNDISVWLPKIRKGGLISGHDYGYWNRGVKQAVHHFFPKERVIARAGKFWGVVV